MRCSGSTPDRLLLVHQADGGQACAFAAIIDLIEPLGKDKRAVAGDRCDRAMPKMVDLSARRSRCGRSTRRQLYVDGKPVGEPFE